MATNGAWGGPSIVAFVVLIGTCQSPPVASTHSASPQAVAHSICSHGAYRHMPGDFPEYGPPQTLYVGTTPDGIGSVYRVQASGWQVSEFYIAGAGQLNYVFSLQGSSIDPATLLWREQSDFNCRGTLNVETDPSNSFFTVYAAEPSDAAYAWPTQSP
ncbi:MAG TPA: hypothetical protein VJT78_13820 [Candidatus Dormibacteraeota bacterium]|nr:hypothetical protein [Candidatus Dormibacteraeota bacterium]